MFGSKKFDVFLKAGEVLASVSMVLCDREGLDLRELALRVSDLSSSSVEAVRGRIWGLKMLSGGS